MITELSSINTTNTMVGPILIVAETTEYATNYAICLEIPGTPGTWEHTQHMNEYAKLYRRAFDGKVWGVTRTTFTLNPKVAEDEGEDDHPF